MHFSTEAIAARGTIKPQVKAPVDCKKLVQEYEEMRARTAEISRLRRENAAAKKRIQEEAEREFHTKLAYAGTFALTYAAVWSVFLATTGMTG